ncbi:hypothetical protein ELH11_38305 [Rhizobium ruizarguesonis]|nr:hypothetical protein ELH11_38305 [Rhizobium ruizarguesonis]
MSRSRQRKRQCRTHVVLLLKRQQWVGFNANTSRSNEPRLMPANAGTEMTRCAPAKSFSIKNFAGNVAALPSAFSHPCREPDKAVALSTTSEAHPPEIAR